MSEEEDEDNSLHGWKDYLATYGWALVIIVVVVFVLWFLTSRPVQENYSFEKEYWAHCDKALANLAEFENNPNSQVRIGTAVELEYNSYFIADCQLQNAYYVNAAKIKQLEAK